MVDEYVEEAVKDLTLSPKTPGMEQMLNAVTRAMFGRIRKSGFCVQCGREVKLEDFKDDASLREYKISALCQVCQDEIFPHSEEVEDPSTDLEGWAEEHAPRHLADYQGSDAYERMDFWEWLYLTHPDVFGEFKLQGKKILDGEPD